MVAEKDCPPELRFLPLYSQISEELLPSPKAVKARFAKSTFVDLTLVQNFFDWTKTDQELVVYTGYGYCDLNIPKTYDCLIDFQLPVSTYPVEATIKFAIWNGWVPHHQMINGHKTVCVLHFQKGFIDEFNHIPTFQQYLDEKKGFTRFALCAEKDFSAILNYYNDDEHMKGFKAKIE